MTARRSRRSSNRAAETVNTAATKWGGRFLKISRPQVACYRRVSSARARNLHLFILSPRCAVESYFSSPAASLLMGTSVTSQRFVAPGINEKQGLRDPAIETVALLPLPLATSETEILGQSVFRSDRALNLWTFQSCYRRNGTRDDRADTRGILEFLFY